MTVNELIFKLQAIQDEGYGVAEVYLGAEGLLHTIGFFTDDETNQPFVGLDGR
jgi:hypothetical protein